MNAGLKDDPKVADAETKKEADPIVGLGDCDIDGDGDDGVEDEGTGSLLTDRQLKVLQLRKDGRSQQEVADILGTTRSNISILEKRARQNIRRAEQTLRQWMMIRAPVSLQVKEGTDVFEIPKMIFEAADQKSIELPVTSLDIVVQLRRKSPKLFRKRAVLKDAEVYVTGEGELLVQETPTPRQMR